MWSCLYEGHVTHRRTQPVSHAFGYPICMAYLDLQEVTVLHRRLRLFGSSRLAPARFQPVDHDLDGTEPLDVQVRRFVAESTGRRPRGAIRLLTQLRWWGHYFSPLNLYYCFDGQRDQLQAVVAEVSNTPWGERHRYVLPCDDYAEKHACYRTAHPKEFHVSPFMPMELEYEWQFNEPGEKTHVRIETRDEQHRFFAARLELKRRPLSDRELLRAIVRYPIMTVQIVTAIYWQACQLWWKKCPTHPHPNQQPDLSSRARPRMSTNRPTAWRPSVGPSQTNARA